MRINNAHAYGPDTHTPKIKRGEVEGGGGGKQDSLERYIAKGQDLAKGNPFIRIT